MSPRVLIRDRDCLFTAKFTSVLDGGGVRNVLTPVRAPDCNAYAKRCVLTIKSECLGKMVFFGDNSLAGPATSSSTTTTTTARNKGWATSLSCAVRPWGPASSSAWSASAAS
jgi:hypothetical protein